MHANEAEIRDCGPYRRARIGPPQLPASIIAWHIVYSLALRKSGLAPDSYSNQYIHTTKMYRAVIEPVYAASRRARIDVALDFLKPGDPWVLPCFISGVVDTVTDNSYFDLADSY